MHRIAISGFALAACLLTVAPARAAQTLYEECASTVTKLKAAGIIQGLTSHGSNPRGFDLLVNQTKWRMIDPSTQTLIVRYAACFVAQGDATIQTSGLVHDTESNKQLGAMSLSGQYFPAPTGPGFSP
jgi:hypothetical protein